MGVDSELDVEDESFVVDDVYKLIISVFVTETEAPETADAFDDAMLEMEGKKSFHCDVCSKVCKSKGGLTRHYNSKHAGDSSAKGQDENITMLSLDDFINILEVTELAFRNEINKSVVIIRNIPTDTIYNATVENPKVKSLWENIVLSCSIEISSATQKLCLENVLKLLESWIFFDMQRTAFQSIV